MENMEKQFPSKQDWENKYSHLFEGKKLEREADKAILKLTFIRHGEKMLSSGSETPLTNRGFFQAAVIGAKREPKDSIDIEYSPTLRTEDTGETIQLSDKVVGEIKENKELDHEGCFSKDFMEGIREIKRKFIVERLKEEGLLPDDFNNLDHEKQVKKLNELLEGLSEEDKRSIDRSATPIQIKKYLEFGDKRPDKDTLSPKELGTRIKDIILRHIKEIKSGKKYKLNSIHEKIHVTHDFHIAAFLYFASEEYKKAIDSEDSDISPTVNPGEGFEVIIKKGKDEEDMELSIFFQGKEYPLSPDIFE